MKNIISISDMKVRAGSLRDELGLNPLFVTQNGKESLVLQTHEAYEHQQEKIAFMEILINSRKDIESGKTELMDDFLNSVEEKIGMTDNKPLLDNYFVKPEDTFQQNNTFTKSMLVSGEHIVETREGERFIIAGDYLLGSDDYEHVESLTDTLEDVNKEQEFDIVKVYSGKILNVTNIVAGKGVLNYLNSDSLTLIWQRESPEKQKQREVIQTLEEDLKRAQKALEEAIREWEEM